jgi:cytochrome c biogenesis protein CcdA
MITAAAVVGAVLGAVVNLRLRSVPSTVRLNLSGGAARLRQSVVGLHLALRRPTSVGWVAWIVGGAILAITLGLRAGWGSAALGIASVGLVRLLDAWFEAPAEVDRVPGPEELLQIDRNTTLSRAALRAVVIGGTAALLSSPAIGGTLGLAAFAVSVGFTAWGRFILVASWCSMSDRLPWRLMAFLRDARARGVLRQVGGVYQFRHAQMQDRLAVRVHS